MKRISLTTWIIIGLVAGIVFGAVLPKQADRARHSGHDFPSPHQIDHCAAAVRHAGIRHRGRGQREDDGPHRRQGDPLLRDRDHHCALRWFGRGQPDQAGRGRPVAKGRGSGSGHATQTTSSLPQILEHVFPTSIIDSMAKGEVLQIVVFAFIFGAACATVGTKARPVVEFCESLSEVMFKYTNYIMLFAPFGVFGAMAATIGERGIGVLRNLGKLVLTLCGAEVFFVVVVLGSVTAIAKIPLRRFIRYVREPFLLAFSTASSESALPIALENMELFGVPKHIVAFVLPTGYSFNLDGSTLYLALAAMFVAQAAGMHVPFGTQLVMMLTLMLTSKGVAGVPRASLVILAGTLATFNLPVEGVAVMLGVDTLMDMARTSVNLLGNCLATAVVARWEGVDLRAVEAVADAQAAVAA